MKRIDLLRTNDEDAHYIMDELNPAHVESSDRRQASPNFFKLQQLEGLASELCHLGHYMG